MTALPIAPVLFVDLSFLTVYRAGGPLWVCISQLSQMGKAVEQLPFHIDLASSSMVLSPQVQAEGGSQTKRMCIRTVSLILYSIIVFQQCWKKYIQMNVVQYCDLVKFAFFTDLAGGQYFGLKKNMAICFVREISFIVTRVKFAFSQIWLGARLLS